MRPKITGRAGKASSRRSTTCGSPPGAIRVSFWSAQVHFELVPNEFGEPAGSWTRTPLPTRAVFGCSCGRGGSRAGCDGSGNSFWKFWNELAHPPVLRPARKQAVHTLIDLGRPSEGSVGTEAAGPRGLIPVRQVHFELVPNELAAPPEGPAREKASTHRLIWADVPRGP